jgi:Domain of unknown function (DUF4145)
VVRWGELNRIYKLLVPQREIISINHFIHESNCEHGVGQMEKTVRVHCNSCGRETKHAVRCAYTMVRGDYIEDINSTLEEKETFETLQCLGCEEITVRQSAEHEAYGQAVPQFYPPRISRRTPAWIDKLPHKIRKIVDEVYRALQANSPVLATMGARTILDLVILDKVGDVGTFSEKLAALEQQGYVGRKNREFVLAALETGSAAAHRGIAPKVDDLNRVMDIVESLLESIYVLEEAAKHLRDVTPSRPERGKGK